VREGEWDIGWEGWRACEKRREREEGRVRRGWGGKR